MNRACNCAFAAACRETWPFFRPNYANMEALRRELGAEEVCVLMCGLHVGGSACAWGWGEGAGAGSGAWAHPRSASSAASY